MDQTSNPLPVNTYPSSPNLEAPTNTPERIQSPPQPPLLKFRFLKYVLLLFFLGVGIASYMVIKNQSPKPLISENTDTSTRPSASPSTFSTETTITAAGFPLRIPKGWKISISNKSDGLFAGRLFIPNTDESTTYLEIQAAGESNFIDNPTLEFTSESKNQSGLSIKIGKEILLESQRVVYQVEKTQSRNKLQLTLYGDQATVGRYKNAIIDMVSSENQSSVIKFPRLTRFVHAQNDSSLSASIPKIIAGFPINSWKKVEVMEGPYPERISKDGYPYKDGYANLYQFEYLAGQRIEILAEENREDLRRVGSFIESELYDMKGELVLNAQTRLSLGVDQLSNSGTYYLLVKSFANREGRFLLKIFDLDQVQDLYYVHYADGSEYVTNNLTKSQTKLQPAVLIVRYTAPIEIVDNNRIRYFRKPDSGCIACDSYVFGDKTIPYVFQVNGVEVPIKITKLSLTQALIQPADGEAFPANSQVSFEIDYGEDPNVPGSRSGFSGGFRTF